MGNKGYSVIQTQAIYFNHSSSEFYSISESLHIRIILSENTLSTLIWFRWAQIQARYFSILELISNPAISARKNGIHYMKHK